MQTKEPAKPFPLAMLLALASALGVAVAVALAGVAMLLAAPAYADEGRLLLERRGALAEASVLLAQSESRPGGHTRVVATYHNPYAERLAGVYLHRLPPNAVLERLTFTPMSGEPNLVYRAVLTRRTAAALVERTAEIGPGESLLVELEYRTLGAARLLKLLEL